MLRSFLDAVEELSAHTILAIVILLLITFMVGCCSGSCDKNSTDPTEYDDNTVWRVVVTNKDNNMVLMDEWGAEYELIPGWVGVYKYDHELLQGIAWGDDDNILVQIIPRRYSATPPRGE
jgi:hypothetical protein